MGRGGARRWVDVFLRAEDLYVVEWGRSVSGARVPIHPARKRARSFGDWAIGQELLEILEGEERKAPWPDDLFTAALQELPAEKGEPIATGMRAMSRKKQESWASLRRAALAAAAAELSDLEAFLLGARLVRLESWPTGVRVVPQIPGRWMGHFKAPLLTRLLARPRRFTAEDLGRLVLELLDVTVPHR